MSNLGGGVSQRSLNVVEQANSIAAAGDPERAMALLRDHLQRDPKSSEVAVALAYLLLGNNRPVEAAAAVEALAGRPYPTIEVLTAFGASLAAMGRLEDAIGVYEKGVEAAPKSGVAEHNLAAATGDAQRFSESKQAAHRAMAKGLDAIETWLVYARALKGLGSYDEAETTYRRILKRRPDMFDAHADLAQLIWMRTEDSFAALLEIETALTMRPRDAGLSRVKAKFLDSINEREAAYAALREALAQPNADPRLDVEAAQIIAWTDGKRALAHAERAALAAPGRGDVLAALCQANLAADRPDVAATIADRLRHGWPNDQFAVALSATAWRMLGDPRYNVLCDYDRFVVGGPIETPEGWSSLDAYLADLRARLVALQRLPGHPIGQSLRQGAQTEQTLTLSTDPVIQAFFKAVDGPIRGYLERARPGDHGLARAPGAGEVGYRVSGAWSVSLRPGGYHINHLHPMGWISSACHIALPGAVELGREGWLAFGEPGIPTNPRLSAEHFVKPRPGHLVLFPSYMWHGTVPFSGQEKRLSVAFDIVPA